MDKRYQIFVSSTYADLQAERQQVIQALMEMDCIPAGMELFPAADEEQFTFIKRIIDDCDYYLLIIGGRYGSISSEGVSYTEMEYDYAVEQGLKVIALLHENPEELPASKVELEQTAREKLAAFREKIASGRLVKFWSRPDQLPGLVALSLSKTIKMYPAVGWIRADQGDSMDLLRQLNDLRQQNEDLRRQLTDIPKPTTISVEQLAQGEDQITISGTSAPSREYSHRHWEFQTTWNEIFSVLGPDLYQYQSEYNCQKILAEYAVRKLKVGTYSPSLDDQSKKIIKIQFIALGLVKVDALPLKGGGYGQFWKITDLGKQILMHIMSIKKDI